MSLKAGRVGVAPDQVDEFGKIKSEASSGYTKQEADAKFQPMTLEVPIKYLNGSVLGTFNTVQETLSGSYGSNGAMTNRELTEQFPTAYNTSGLTYNNCTYVAGGYCKIGKLVVVNIRVKVTASNTDIEITGFPSYSNKTLNSKNIIAVNALNLTDDSNVNYCAVMGVTGSLRVKNPLVADKEYAMSALYLAD